MANYDANQIGREIMALSFRLKKAQHDKDWIAIDGIIQGLHEAGEKALAMDLDIVDRCKLYVVTTQPVFEFYFQQQDYRAAGDLIIESLNNVSELFDLFDQEVPTTIVFKHLFDLFNVVASAEVKHHEDPSTISESWSNAVRDPFYDYKYRLMCMLADLLSQALENLKQINPTVPLINHYAPFFDQLRKADMLGHSDCELDNLATELELISLNWSFISVLYERLD